MTGGSDHWSGAVIYQVYPRSFADSNGDGIGDLPGLIDKLDYIAALGVDALWVSPFFAGPGRDHGYDISDYTAVDPLMGSMTDAEALIEGCHRRGLKILFDMVLNHTSDTHPWFRESRSSLTNPKRDWYVWQPGRGPGGKRPPNNWSSMIGGSGWHRDPATGEWYWTQFLPFQPDLNWRNPEVREAMFASLRFWLDKGVDGFRLDIIGSLFEDGEFRDNPPSRRFFPSEESGDLLFRSSVMTRNLPETAAFARVLRQLTDRYSDRFLIGEAFGTPGELRALTGGSKGDGLHAVFLFKTLSVPFRAGALKRMIEGFEKDYPPPEQPVYVFSNHDRSRSRSRLRLNDKRARLLALLQLTLRGRAVIYNGEELGLPDGKIPFRDAVDPLAVRMAGLPPILAEAANKLVHGGLNRDRCRTPIPWDPESPPQWLPYSEDPAKRNARDQADDPGSLLSWYRHLLFLRRKYPELATAPLEWLCNLPRGVIGYRRGRFEILINLSGGTRMGLLQQSGRIIGPDC
jgi:oligo-1,6-glucosidase/alpha-glucosidase